MPIELDDVASGYNLSVINSNFQKIEDKMNQEVLWRKNSDVAGEAKMERDLDMDSNNILNAMVGDIPLSEIAEQTQNVTMALKDGGYGYKTVDSFQDGATLNYWNEVLRWELPDGDGEYYRWDGALPKVVPPGSTPASTGGIGEGAWLSVGDASLRTDLNSSVVGKGASLVKLESGMSVQDWTESLILQDALYADIRSYAGNNTAIYCVGRSNSQDGAGGLFTLDASIVAPVDNDGTLLVDALGRAWVRQNADVVLAEWFGVTYSGSNEVVALQKAVDAAYGKTLHLNGIVTIASTLNINDKLFLTSAFDSQVGTAGIYKSTAGTMINVGAVPSGVRIKRLTLTHDGDGIIINLAGGETHQVDENSIVAGSAAASSTQPVIYFNGSNVWIKNNRITNFRVNSYCVDADRMTGKININSVIDANYFGGPSWGIRVGSSDGSARPEGLTISSNISVLTGYTFLHVFSVLSLRIVNNMIDQCNGYAIWLEPITFPIEAVLVQGNYIATATNPSGGIGILAVDNDAGSVTADVIVADNKFEHSGGGCAFGRRSSWIKIHHNDFKGLPQTAVSFQQTVAGTLDGNQFNGNNFDLSIRDGAAGGHYIVANNYFTGFIDQVRTDPARYHVSNNTNYS